MKNIAALKQQYEEYMYPLPLDSLDGEKEKVPPAGIPCGLNWAKMFPERTYQAEGLKILIAGCGANQAARFAYHYPQHQFIGVDLSANSLKNSENLKKKHKLENLEHIQASLLELDYEKEFDLIISTGVVHHLANPKSAVRKFTQYLKDNGACYIMVYGYFMHQPLATYKRATQFLDLKQNAEGVDATRTIFSKMSSVHPCKQLYESSNDKNYDAGIVDMWLHSMQHHYSAKEVLNLINDTGLYLQNWYFPEIFFPNVFTYVPGAIEKYYKLDLVSQWEIGEFIQHWDRKVFFILRKDKSCEKFQQLDLDHCRDYYPCLVPISKDTKVSKLPNDLIEISYKKSYAGPNSFLLSAKTPEFIQIATGEKTFEEIMQSLELDDTLLQDMQTLYRIGMLTLLSQHRDGFFSDAETNKQMNHH